MRYGGESAPAGMLGVLPSNVTTLGSFSIEDAIEDLKVEDQWIRDDGEKATTLAAIFFPKLLATSLPMHEDINAAWDTARAPGKLVGPEVTTKEICKMCYRMRSKAATGVDDLSILIMKRCSRELIPFLQRLFTASLSLGFLPFTVEGSQSAGPVQAG